MRPFYVRRQRRKATLIAKILSRADDDSRSLDIDRSEEGLNKCGPLASSTNPVNPSTASQKSTSTAARQPIGDAGRVPAVSRGSVGVDRCVDQADRGQRAEHPWRAAAVPNSVRSMSTGCNVAATPDTAPRDGGELDERNKQKKSRTKASIHRITPVTRNKSKNRSGDGECGGSDPGASPAFATSSSSRASCPRLRALRLELNTLLVPTRNANTARTKASTKASTEVPTPAVVPAPLPKKEDRQRKQLYDGDDGVKQKDGRVWDFLSSLALVGVSLDNLFVAGITEEELVGVTRGLKYACERQLGGNLDASSGGGDGGGSSGAATAVNNDGDGRGPLEVGLEWVGA